MENIDKIVQFAEDKDFGYRFLDQNSLMLSGDEELSGPKVIVSVHTLPPLEQPVPGMTMVGYTLHRLEDGKVMKERTLQQTLSNLNGLLNG